LSGVNLLQWIGGRAGALVTGLFVTAFASVFFIVGIWSTTAGVRRVLAYKPVQAEITKVTGKEPSAFQASITYAYVVDGKTYTGKDTANEDDDEERFNLYRGKELGQRITVYYDPGDPGESSPSLDVQCWLLGFSTFSLPFLVLGLNSLVRGLTGREVIRSKRPNAQSDPVPGGVWFWAFVGICVACTVAQVVGGSLLPWPLNFIFSAAVLSAAVPLLTWWLVLFVRRRQREKRRRDRALPAGSPLPGRGLFAGLLVGATFWCGITSIFVVHVARSIWRHTDAQRRFLTTEGEVLASRIRQHTDGEGGTTYRPIIRYRYTVNGRQHTSKRYDFADFGTGNRGHVAGIVDAHPPGKRVTVYYDPDDPAQAVLHVELPGLQYFLLVFLQPFVVIGLGLLGSVITAAGHRRGVREFLAAEAHVPWAIPTWGVLRQSPGGVAICRRLRGRVILLIAGVGYAATCVVSLAVLGLLVGRPETTTPGGVGTVTAIAAGVGLLAALAFLATRGRQGAKLHIDTSLRKLTLSSRRRHHELSFDEIDSWTLRKIDDPRTAERRKVLLLAVKTVDGGDVPIHVFTANAWAPQVAERAGRELAQLTGRPFAPSQEQEEPQVSQVHGLGDALALLKKQSQARRQYADLM
jgi:hypothetical protein